MSARFPFTSYPRGWFRVSHSDDLPVGGVVPLSYFGKELVLFRTEDGTAHLLDAYCPHLGAHLGIGGRVMQGTIQCPFHGWRFDGRGSCVDIPHAPKIPPNAAVRVWPLQEVNGLIFAYHAPDASEPSWHVPALVEYGSAQWSSYQKRQWKIRTHVQEISENIVDSSHFRYVHQTLSIPETTTTVTNHVLRVVSLVKQQTPRGPVNGRLDGEAHGLGFWAVRFSGITELLSIITATPIDEEHVDLRLSFLTSNSNVGNALVAEIARQVDEDVPIWEGKIYRPKPLLSAGDGSIMSLRKWSQQFYE